MSSVPWTRWLGQRSAGGHAMTISASHQAPSAITLCARPASFPLGPCTCCATGHHAATEAGNAQTSQRSEDRVGDELVSGARFLQARVWLRPPQATGNSRPGHSPCVGRLPGGNHAGCAPARPTLQTAERERRAPRAPQPQRRRSLLRGTLEQRVGDGNVEHRVRLGVCVELHRLNIACGSRPAATMTCRVGGAGWTRAPRCAPR